MSEGLILAQTAVDPLSGGAGWVGAGLLGAVLCWLLLKHLPDQNKQQKELITDHKQQINSLHSECAAERKEQHGQFNMALEKVLDRHEKDSQQVCNTLVAVQKSIDSLAKHA